jgi:lipoprotein NlpI
MLAGKCTLPLLGLAILLGSIAHAETNDASACQKMADAALSNPSVRPAGVTACTAAIDSRKFAGQDLADLHRLRGYLRDGAGEFSAAIDDYTDALQITPKNPRLYGLRADAYLGLGNLKKAIDDSSESLRIDPTEWGELSSRGRYFYLDSQYKLAAQDFSRALLSAEQWAQSGLVLWLYVAQMRAADTRGEAELAANTKKYKVDNDDLPVVTFFLKKLSESSLLEAINSKKADPCDTFFLAQYYLMNGNNPFAEKAVRYATNVCHPQSDVARAANYQLKQFAH